MKICCITQGIQTGAWEKGISGRSKGKDANIKAGFTRTRNIEVTSVAEAARST